MPQTSDLFYSDAHMFHNFSNPGALNPWAASSDVLRKVLQVCLVLQKSGGRSGVRKSVCWAGKGA